MRKLKLLFMACALMMGAGQAWAQTDVTNTYITNPGFEGSSTIKTTFQAGTKDERYIFEPEGWTVVHTNPNTNDLTCLTSSDKQANSFSSYTMNHSGDKTYWIRLRWGGQTWRSQAEGGPTGNPTSIELQQSITLPNGVYRLRADLLCYANGTEANNHVYLKASSSNNTWSVEPTIKHSHSDSNWENKSLIITSSGNTQYTIGLVNQQNWVGEFISGFDDVTLEKYDVDEDHTFDITSIVPKGTGNWTNNGANNAGSYSNGGVTMVERYYKSHYTGTVSELVVKDLALGVYDAEVYCHAHCADWDCSAISEAAGQTDRTILSANGVEVGIPIVNDRNLTEGPQVRTLTNIKVTDGTLTFQIRNDQEGANWLTFEIKSLVYKGTDLSEIKANYNAAKTAAEAARDNATYSSIIGAERTALINAINASVEENADAYIAATNTLISATEQFNATTLAHYTLLNTEKEKAAALGMTTEAINTATATTKTGLLALQDLKVAEYDYVTTEYQYGVTLGEWTSTATNTKAANFNNEHWSGTTHNYKNQDDSNGQGWNASSWSINFNQDVTLPAGKYVFKVAGRQASDEHVTTSLVVMNGETELGTVSDFPRSNSARGINKSGRTSFNENNDQYANSGNGYGWEWRYVKFELDEDATVNIAINAVATASHCWVSFGDYTLQTDEEANIALIAYNVALNNARTVLNDATYANVQGTDRSNLQAAINADETLDKNNKADIETATTNLNTAADAFINGLASWNAYVMVKGYADLINNIALPYASEEKITAVTTAKNVTVNTAADADTQTAAINTANRAAYESNALAEGVATAVNVTNIIQNADGSATTGWSGSFWTASNEAYTEANGNATNTYFDKNGVKSFETSQTIHLLKGNYILSVTARAQANINSFKMQATNNAGETEEIDLTAMGNTNGVFNRGWNDFTLAFEQEADGDATIKIVADNTTNDANFWMSWDRFRLVSLDAINEPVEVTSAGFATYVSDYNLDYSGVTGLKAYKATVSENTITFERVTTVPAGEGVLLRGAGDTYSVPVTAGVAAWGAEDNAFIRGTGEAVETGSGPYNYILNKVNDVIGFYRANGQTVATNRAYLQTTTNAARLNISFDDDDQTTGIARVEETVANDAVYTLSGVRVEKPTKGLYIKNGKKVVIK